MLSFVFPGKKGNQSNKRERNDRHGKKLHRKIDVRSPYRLVSLSLLSEFILGSSEYYVSRLFSISLTTLVSGDGSGCYMGSVLNWKAERRVPASFLLSIFL